MIVFVLIVQYNVKNELFLPEIREIEFQKTIFKIITESFTRKSIAT